MVYFFVSHLGAFGFFFSPSCPSQIWDIIVIRKDKNGQPCLAIDTGEIFHSFTAKYVSLEIFIDDFY